MKTHKKCRGIGKALNYGCGKELPIDMFGKSNFKYGLGISCRCFSLWLLNSDNGKKMIEDARLKAKKEVVRKDKERIKTIKESLEDWSKELQKRVNKIVRIIDFGQPCLARNYHPNQIHAGHIFSRGSSKTIRFNLHNIHRQSAQSNHFGNDDGLLREGLVKEYGQDYFDFISELRQTPSLKYNNMDFKDFYLKANEIIKDFNSIGEKVYNKESRIFLRNEVNTYLGIYDEKYLEFKIK